MEIFGYNAQRHMWPQPDTADQQKHFMPTVKHGVGGVMIWARYTGPRHLAIIEPTFIPLHTKVQRVRVSGTESSYKHVRD